MDQYPEVFLDNRRFCIGFNLVGMVNVLDRYNEINIQLANEKKIEILDLAHAIPKSLEFFGDNVHYANKGATLIAKLLAEKLLTDKKQVLDL